MDDNSLVPEDVPSLLSNYDSGNNEGNKSKGDNQALTGNPSTAVEPPAPAKADRSLSQSEIDAMLKSLGIG